MAISAFIFIGIVLFVIMFIVIRIINTIKKVKKNPQTQDAQKEQIVNYAFDNLLTRDKDYTVVGEVEGAILVKKQVRWIYFETTSKGMEGIFTITTDKGEFAFQISKGEISRFPISLIPKSKMQEEQLKTPAETQKEKIEEKSLEARTELEDKHYYEKIVIDNDDSDTIAEIEAQISGKKTKNKK